MLFIIYRNFSSSSILADGCRNSLHGSGCNKDFIGFVLLNNVISIVQHQHQHSMIEQYGEADNIKTMDIRHNLLLQSVVPASQSRVTWLDPDVN